MKTYVDRAATHSARFKYRKVAERVQFADIHKSKALSDLIQRKLKEERAADIAEYLQTNAHCETGSLSVRRCRGSAS